MIKLNQVIEQNIGFKYLINKLEIKSRAGKNHLFEKRFLSSANEIKQEFDNIAEIIEIISESENQKYINGLQAKISQVRDISSTIVNMSSDTVLDDVQLFEIKHLAIVSDEISDIIKKLQISFIEVPDAKDIVKILDPDGQNIPHFYIYSSYSEKLANLRKKLSNYQSEKDYDTAEKYRLLCLDEEDRIRKTLSEKLSPFSKILKNILNDIAETDVIIAKSILAVELNFCKPEISLDITEYHNIFNPYIKSILQEQNKYFQPVNIKLSSEPVLITGANMSGKTVLLKTVELTQYLFQFGFYIPAEKAEIEPVDEILTSFDEKNDLLSGLSSFAAEILNVNKIIISAIKGRKILALIDELARTTNPEEGKAIVTACLEILGKNKIKSLITTHYSGIKSDCRKLRVKGLQVTESINKITIENINDFIDYSLTETDDVQVPEEALKIAEILGVDNEFLTLAKNKLK